MPEGHTLHRLAREHTALFAGHAVRVSSPQGRFADGAALVDGRLFLGADAWGKHLVHMYEGGANVHVHLGLYGAFTVQRSPMAEPVGQVRMRVSGPEFGTDLRGPTACEVLTGPEVDALYARLGQDPLRDDSEPSVAYEKVRRSRAPIGSLLMDQKVVAGVGNVYRAELLYRHRINPYRAGNKIAEHVWAAMWEDLVALMAVGVQEGRMITVDAGDDHGAPPYEPGRPRTYVYRRAGEPCRRCGTAVAHALLQGRNLFWCPTCQDE